MKVTRGGSYWTDLLSSHVAARQAEDPFDDGLIAGVRCAWDLLGGERGGPPLTP